MFLIHYSKPHCLSENANGYIVKEETGLYVNAEPIGLCLRLLAYSLNVLFIRVLYREA